MNYFFSKQHLRFPKPLGQQVFESVDSAQKLPIGCLPSEAKLDFRVRAEVLIVKICVGKSVVELLDACQNLCVWDVFCAGFGGRCG